MWQGTIPRLVCSLTLQCRSVSRRGCQCPNKKLGKTSERCIWPHLERVKGLLGGLPIAKCVKISAALLILVSTALCSDSLFLGVGEGTASVAPDGGAVEVAIDGTAEGPP